MRRTTKLIVTLLLAAGLAQTAAAAAATPLPPAAPADLSAAARVKERGWINLTVTGVPGSTIAVTEAVGEVDVPVAGLTLRGPTGGRQRLTAWRCDRRRSRAFDVTATLPDGTTQRDRTTVTTPACNRRIELRATAARPGGTVTVSLLDRFAVGDLEATVCSGPAGRTPACRPVRLGAGQTRRALSVPTPRIGRYRIELRTPFGQRAARTVTARRPGGAFRLLATGDSQIQIVDGFLARRLRASGGRVTSDAHISTGLSKPFELNWPAHARGSAGALKPDATVMIIGANDGYSMPRRGGGSVACCGQAWQDSYADRVAGMMRTYLRGGRARVYWLLLPDARAAAFQRVFRVVNRAIEDAGRRFDADDVTVVDLRRTFTPGGRFRQVISYGGRTVSVRQPDGVHLNVAGASIAADIVVAALRRDGY
ncbi:hypothetical protein DSM112329_00693 [Paraconexibacter sp. AEG42_29]|uniref:SGNH hydrolase-type esterase domain-containing protein n=1 Tax=Paraconexibacter sp. AEG42_29 TaxID=2997339 RepID=A0AAU7AQF4_9ACTN